MTSNGSHCSIKFFIDWQIRKHVTLVPQQCLNPKSTALDILDKGALHVAQVPSSWDKLCLGESFRVEVLGFRGYL